MKTKTIISGVVIAALLQLGVLACSAQTAQPFPTAYLYSGSETNATLDPGNYIITAYGAAGGGRFNNLIGGNGAEMSAEFDFSTRTTLTLLVGGQGDTAATYCNGNGGGGGGGSFVVEGSTPLVVAGGGGGGAAFDEFAYVSARGGNGTITTNGGAGGGDAGGSGGAGGGGGAGGDPSLTGLFGPHNGAGAGGGGGCYTDGTSGRPVIFYALPEREGAGGAAAPGGGGLSFVDGGAGGLSNFGTPFSGNGGFGGGGGGYSDNSYAFGGGGGGYSGGGGGGASDTTTRVGGGGAGGSFIDSSATAILSPPAPTQFNGEIIIANVAANIFQWQYINPNTPSLGKEISTTPCLGGGGATWVPNANLSGLDLTRAYLQGAYLNSANLISTTLTNADLVEASLAHANLGGATLTNADLANANLEYSTLSGANLTNANLTNAKLYSATLTGANLANANLSNANLTIATLVNANLGNADLANASLEEATLTNANLTNANLANAWLPLSTLTNANLTNADLRGAATGNANTSGAIVTNTINPDGTVNGLHLTAAAPLMTIHNYHAPAASTYTGAIHISDQFALDSGTTLQMIVDGPQWNSLISFDAGIPITLTGGNLVLEVDPSVNPASLVGIPFQLFDFSNVTPDGQFTVTTDLPASEFQWDTSQLYSNGTVTLDAVPEPTSASLLVIGSLALLCRRVRRSDVEPANVVS